MTLQVKFLFGAAGGSYFSFGRSVGFHRVDWLLSFNDLFFFHLQTTFMFFTCQRWLSSPFQVQFETCPV